MACAVWQHEPAEAVDLLSSGKVELSPAQAANLADIIDFKDSQEVSLLERVWKAITPNHSIAQDLETTKAVLIKGGLGSPADPDLALALWCRALGIEAHDSLKKLIFAADTSDIQRTRLVHQIIRNEGRRNEKASAEMPELVLQLLQVEDSPLTWAAVNQRRGDITNGFSTQEERSSYAKLLLNNLRHGASDTAKGYMAAWAKTLGTEAVLKDVKPEGLSEGDIDIIGNVFGPSRQMNGLLRRWKNKK
jgi:hypothetical protein